MTAAQSLRRFNRIYTQRIGALDESFLGSGRSLGLSRLLFEIGHRGADVLELRSRLGLDSGYVSRMLRQLEADGLVQVATHEADRRRRMVALTTSGRREWDRLDAESDRVADEMVAPLSREQRAALADALDTAGRLIAGATVEFDVVDPLDVDAQHAMARYFEELDRRFPGGFDPGDATTADAEAMSRPDGVFVLVHSDGNPVGCGGVQRIDGATAEVKRMWIRPDWRGLGLASRLLAELEGHAARLGHRRVVLDTNSTLREAVGLYESRGYEATDRYNDNPYAQRWYRKDLRSDG